MKIALLSIFSLVCLVVSAPVLAVQNDSHKPIRIISETLLVLPEQEMANFKGKVKASQGVMKLYSSAMIVRYRNADERKEGQSSISSIHADGEVKLITEDREATADVADYDVDKGQVVLSGNVVLKRNGTVLRGEQFVYDVAKAESRLLNNRAVAASKPVSSSARKAEKAPRKQQRVRASFVPVSKPGAVPSSEVAPKQAPAKTMVNKPSEGAITRSQILDALKEQQGLGSASLPSNIPVPVKKPSYR